MFEQLALSLFCFLVVLIGLAIAAWEVISGRIFSMDSLWLTLISLSLAAVFGGALGWSFYTGEAQQMLRHFRKTSKPKDPAQQNPPASI